MVHPHIPLETSLPGDVEKWWFCSLPVQRDSLYRTKDYSWSLRGCYLVKSLLTNTSAVVFNMILLSSRKEQVASIGTSLEPKWAYLV